MSNRTMCGLVFFILCCMMTLICVFKAFSMFSVCCWSDPNTWNENFGNMNIFTALNIHTLDFLSPQTGQKPKESYEWTEAWLEWDVGFWCLYSSRATSATESWSVVREKGSKVVYRLLDCHLTTTFNSI